MAWTSEQPKPNDAQNELKNRFALEWLRRGDPWPAALAVLGHQDPGKASLAASSWPFDPYVIAKRNALLEEFGEDYFLPSKADLARTVWNEAMNLRTAIDKTRNLRLYAEIMGFVAKDVGKGKLSGNVTVTLADGDKDL